MEEVATLLNALRDSGLVTDYARFGATAQMRYTEPVATLHADVLVSVPVPDGIKDFARVLALLESGSVTRGQVAAVAAHADLFDAWTRFAARFLDERR